MFFNPVPNNTNNEVEVIASAFNCPSLDEAAAIRDARRTIDHIFSITITNNFLFTIILS